MLQLSDFDHNIFFHVMTNKDRKKLTMCERPNQMQSKFSFFIVPDRLVN